MNSSPRNKAVCGGASAAVDAPDHQQDAADLRQQCQKDQSQHREIIGRGPQRTQTRPRNDSDGRFGLRVCGLFDRAHGHVDRLPPLGDCRLPFPAKLPDAAFAFPVPCCHRVTERGLGRRHGWRCA